jgi:hypothetical protein
VPGITFAPAFIVSQDSHCQRDGPGGLAGALLAARRASRGSRFMLILLAGERGGGEGGGEGGGGKRATCSRNERGCICRCGDAAMHARVTVRRALSPRLSVLISLAAVNYDPVVETRDLRDRQLRC